MIYQQLELADHFFSDVGSGKKIKTLRWNEPKIIKGFLMFTGSKNPALKATVCVHEVSFGNAKTFAKLYNMTCEELIIGMNKHYTNVPPNAEFMLVEYLSPEASKKVKGYDKFIKLERIEN